MKKISSVLSVVFCVVFCSAKPPGLPNQGNSCYMNAVLQNMLNIPPLNTILVSMEIKPGGLLIPEYIELVREYNSGSISENALKSFYTSVNQLLEQSILNEILRLQKKGLNDKEILKAIFEKRKKYEEKKKHKKVIDFLKDVLKDLDKFTGEIEVFLEGLTTRAKNALGENYRQQDAVEFYNQFLEKLTDKSLMASSAVDKINTLFSISSQVLEEKGLFRDTDEFLLTGVPIENGALDLEKFFGSIIKYRRFLGVPPKILVISPLRVSGEGKKTKAVLNIPESLKLKKEYFLDDVGINSDFSYTLLGIVIHSGDDFYSGHYTARIREFDTQLWWKCDDSIITFLSLQDFNKDEFVKKNAYMLFYIEKDYYATVLRQREQEKRGQEKREREKREQEKKARENLNALAQSLYELAKPE